MYVCKEIIYLNHIVIMEGKRTAEIINWSRKLMYNINKKKTLAYTTNMQFTCNYLQFIKLYY